MNAEFLLSSLAAHPQSAPEDAIKFIYQNAFGCGHLLPEAAVCAENIRLEMERTPSDDTEPAFEPLGAGLCRLNLRSPLVRALPPLRIARMMCVTAERFQVSPERYADNLALLRSLAARRNAPSPGIPFTVEALETAVKRREAEGGLPGHSETYRAAYRPAYRVVFRRYGEALPLLDALEKRLADTGRAVLALDGNCASGKTTLASLLAPLYDANVFHMDDFFLPFALRTPKRLKTPGGNVHYERFQREVLEGLLTGEPFAYGAFDCHTGETRAVAVTPRPVALIEGSYALHPAFDSAYEALDAVRALLTLPPGEQESRIEARDGAASLSRFRNEWIPLENRYFEAYHKTRANRLVLSGRRYPEDE